LIALAALLAVSCCSDYKEESPDPAQEARLYRGHALYAHEVRTFRPCGRDDPLWAIEPDGIFRSLHQAPYQEIFAVVEAHELPAPADGFGADYPGALQI
jgi:hypothetical protein